MNKLLPLLLAIALLPIAATSEATAAPRVVAKPVVKTSVQRAKDYATKHKLPTRKVKVTSRDGAKLQRIFVPVLKHTQPDFIAKFSTKENSVIWRHHERDHIHAHLILGDKDHVGYMKGPHAIHNAEEFNAMTDAMLMGSAPKAKRGDQ